MKKINLIISCLCLVLVLVAMPILTACGETTPETYEIEIYGGRAGMSTYVASIALAELINENSTWLKATAIEATSVTACFQLLLNEISEVAANDSWSVMAGLLVKEMLEILL